MRAEEARLNEMLRKEGKKCDERGEENDGIKAWNMKRKGRKLRERSKAERKVRKEEKKYIWRGQKI